jgi:hypothetical protein
MIRINWLDFIFFLSLDCFWKDLHFAGDAFAYEDSPSKMLGYATSG